MYARMVSDFTRPHCSPSGVSLGHTMPNCDGWSARGPLIFCAFSTCERMRVMCPMAAMYDRRVTGYASSPRLAGTSATPLRSMWKRLSTQLPDLMAFTHPLVMMSWNCCITGTTSNAFTRAVYASSRREADTF